MMHVCDKSDPNRSCYFQLGGVGANRHCEIRRYVGAKQSPITTSLQFKKLCISIARGQQFLVCAQLCNATIINDCNSVGNANRRKAMRYNNANAAFEIFF